MSYGYSSLLPKREINADIFANDNKKWNGNLTRIAIWDTGVDPTAAGLQITPDGKPKIVDMIDASGSGDVKMKCKRHVDQVNRTIETLTGRKVEIPNHWNPPDGIIRIGVKLASELFPKLLMQRLRNENRDNFWRPSIKRLAANLACDLTEAEEYLSDITQNINRISISSSDKDSPRKFVENDSSKTLHDDILCTDQKTDPISCQMNSNFSSHQVKREKREQFGLTPTAAKAQLKAAARSLEDSLSLLDQRYSPMEILYDCFVFHNGSEWVACVDTSPYNPGKKLSDLPLLRDYTVNHEYASFGEQTQLYYTVKIFDNGKLLQIVTNNSSHGTHVAAIASAYFPACSSKHPSKHSPRKQPTDVFASANKTITDAAKSISHFCDRNGVAPGAQIVSIKISDGRLGPMETGISLLRAIRWTIELQCDIVNYSFGEQVIWPNVGRISKYLNRMIHKHGIIMVASGGNNGPSLGTLSCPGGTVQGVIGVAPLVFPDMMRNLYSQPDDPFALQYQSTCEDSSSYNDSLQATCQQDEMNTVSQNSQTAQPTAYNWGSRGPAFDGALGLCVAAPGGANTSIASWQLKPCGLLSGSSMSAPMVTGGISLLLSGLRHRYKCIDDGLLKIPPTLIYLSLINTSKSIEHLSYLDQGYGLMQVDKAFQYLDHILNTLYEGNTSNMLENKIDIAYGGSVVTVSDNRNVDDNIKEKSSTCQLLSIPDPCITHGWHIRITVSGPGCSPNSRGIWLRRGWLLSPRTFNNIASSSSSSSSSSSKLPLLRFTLHMNIEFDEYVPLSVRRSTEFHLTTELISELKGLTNSNGWLQIASIITVTSISRDINCVIDPVRFSKLLMNSNSTGSKDETHSDIDHLLLHNMMTAVPANSSDENLPTNQRSMKAKGNQTEESQSQPSMSFLQQSQYRQSQLSGFSWPSNLPTAVNCSVNNIPVKSQKPYVMLIGFKATDRPEMGILASLPIIVQIPHRLNRYCDTMDQPHFLFSDKFDAKNKVRRWFVEVPYGATAGILRLARLDNDGDKSCEFTITINSPCIGMNSDKQEVKWSFVELNKCGQSKSGLKRNDKSSPVLSADDFDCASQFAFPINWETDCLELTIAQHWGLEMPAIVVGELYFRGLEPSLRNIVLNTSDRYCRIGLHSNFASESIQPDIWLTHWCLSVKPYDSKIFYLGHGKNELLVNGHSSYALRLMYRFSCPFKTATTVICLPWLQDMLYSSDYLIHIFHIYDSRGRFMGAGEYDGHREQRPKFTFNLSKGDFKVIAQICHESGPLLKRGSPTKLPTVSSTTSNELCDTLEESETGDSNSVNSSWSPLQALQNTPLLVRFRLTTSGMETTTTTPTGGTTGAGRKLGSSSSSTGQSIVRFEFSALPSSLNLNGIKACSAMDPLMYDAKQTLMVGTGDDDDNSDNNSNNNSNNADGDRRRSSSVGGDGVSGESFSNENATDEESKSSRFELIRRLPCLPSRVNACETISIFLGLTDERYPSYAVPGSYFSGTIGFYKSNLLHNKVTYPFRLILDNSNLLTTTTTAAATTTTTSLASSSIVTPSSPLTTTLAPTSSEQPKKLPISYMGIGVEDIEWIQCIGDLFLFRNKSKKLIENNELANSIRKTFNNHDDLQVQRQQEKQAKEKEEEKFQHKYHHQQQQNHKDDNGDHQPVTKCLLNLCEQAMIMETVQTIPNNQYPDDMLSSNWSVHSVSFDDTKCEEVSDFNESASTMTDVQKDKKIPSSPVNKWSESIAPAKNDVDDAPISTPTPPPRPTTTSTNNCSNPYILNGVDLSTQPETTTYAVTTTTALTSTLTTTTIIKHPPTVNDNQNKAMNNTPDDFYTILCKLHADLSTMDKPMTTYTTNINDISSIGRSCSSGSGVGRIGDISNSSEISQSINHLYMIVKERHHLWCSADHLINGRLLDEKISLKVLKTFCCDDDVDTFKHKSESLSSMTTHQNIFQYLINIPIPSTSVVNLTSTTAAVNSNTKSSVPSDTPNKLSPANSDLLMPISPTAQSSKGKISSVDCSPTNTNRTKSVECIITGKLDNTPVDSVSTKTQSQKPITFSQHEFKLRLIDILSRYGRLIAERLICFNFLYNNVIDFKQKPSNWSLCHSLQSQMKITHQLMNNYDADSTMDYISMVTFPELFKHLDDIYQRLIKLTSQTPTSNDTIGVNVKLGNQALPSWLLLSIDGKLSKNTNTKLGNMHYGSVGGRLIAFFILYMIVKKQYPEAVGYFTRLLYQIDEPPIGALRGVINCGIPVTPTSSFGIRRPCHATLENSMKTAKSAHPWLLWLLRQIGWNDIAAYLEQQKPILFPGGDYTLLGGDHV